MVQFHSLIPLLHWVALCMSLEAYRIMHKRGAAVRSFQFLPFIPLLTAGLSSTLHWRSTQLFVDLPGMVLCAFDFGSAVLLIGAMMMVRRVLDHTDAMHTRLSDSEMRYRTIFELTGTAIMIVGEDDTVELVNFEFERLAGFSKQEVQGIKPWTDFFAGASLTRLISDHALRRQYVHAVPRHYEAFFINKLNSRREVYITVGMLSSTGKAVYSLIDMTEQKQTLEALLTAEERYRGIFENAIEGIFQSTPDGHYLHANPTLARIYGYESPEEMLREITSISDQLYVDPTRRADFVSEISQASEVRNFESQVRRRNGEIIWISENARAVHNHSGEVVYYEGMVEDITESKLNEITMQAQYQLLQKTIDELETAQSALVEQERLRALGQMASGIAHDFNNTLSPILGFTELLLKRPANLDDKPKTKRYLEMIHTAAKDAGNVVRCLREFYRLRNDQELGQPIDVNSLIQEVIQLTQPRWKNQAQATGVNIQISTDLTPVPPLQGIESSLREAMTNLIFNAVDAMHEGGTLTLATRTSENRIVIEVRDTGMGMDPETRKRCLEPFFTTKGARGTGLGLAMTYGVINRHGGTITVDSEIGKGTTFRLVLPVSERSRKAAPIDESTEAIVGGRILLIEDDPLVREVILEYLRGEGYEVTTAMHGRDGLSKYHPDAFDLVLTDRAMPELSGDQVAAAIRKINSSQPIVMLTGFGDMMDAVSELPLGIDAIISKPVTMPVLLSTVRQAIMRGQEEAVA